MKTYRVVIMGCRDRGTAIGRAYRAHPRTKVVGLCDRHPERTDALGVELDVAARFSDLDQAIRQTKPDVVVVATGTQSHFELGMRVIEHGVHLDLEKPICTDLIQADTLVEHAAKKGVRIAVHHQGRTGAAFQTALCALKDGRIGDVRHVISCGKNYYGGYGLIHIGTHLLNAMLAFTGRCRRVTAHALTGGRPIHPEDVVQAPMGAGVIAGEDITALLEFESGLGATILEHRRPGMEYGLELIGTGGRLACSIRLSNSGVWRMPDLRYAQGEAIQWEQINTLHKYSGVAQNISDDYAFVDEYVRALDENREHVCNGDEGRHVLEMVMGIYESAACRKTVELPQVQRDHPLLRWRRESGFGPPFAMPWSYEEWLAAEDQRLI